MQAIGNHITVLNTIDSSNNYAMQQVHAGMAEHGQVWFALEQTAGKGQRGKTWKGATAENILMSVVLETGKLTIAQQFRLSATVAVGVRNFFACHAGPETFIKWPNDLYWCDRKAGGILIENVIGRPSAADHEPTNDSSWKCAVVGIGVNINQTVFPPDLPNPISLHHITHKKYEMMELVKELCHCLQEQWELLVNGRWGSIYAAYNQHLYKQGQPVRLRKNNVVMPCTIRGVSDDGKLLIAEDKTVKFDFGEVSWEL